MSVLKSVFGEKELCDEAGVATADNIALLRSAVIRLLYPINIALPPERGDSFTLSYKHCTPSGVITALTHSSGAGS